MTEILLLADVAKLGKAGAIVTVAPGYARNFLFPKDLAAPVTVAARRRLAKLEAERAKARAEAKKAAEELAGKLVGLTVTVSAQVKKDEDGTPTKFLYGGVKVSDLLAAIEADRGVKFERGQLDLPDQLKETGVFQGKIDLGQGVFAPFTVVINAAAED